MERDDLGALEARLEGVVPMTAAFEAELARLGQTMLFTGREVGTLSTAFGSGLGRTLPGRLVIIKAEQGVTPARRFYRRIFLCRLG